MNEPGLDQHLWASEWEALEPLVVDAPAEALPELDDLVARMMEARGLPLEEREGEDVGQPETTREFQEARRITRLLDTGGTVDPGDIGAAVQAYRGLYTQLLDFGPTSGASA